MQFWTVTMGGRSPKQALEQRYSRLTKLALVIGAKERPSMSAKIKYTDEPLGKIQVVPDFLPSPRVS